jgi:hypothetical protein
MLAWTLSALRRYYRDPPVVFLSKGANEGVEPFIVAAGFYISPHCDPDCCGALGISILSMGPFRTAGAAQKWSRDNLVAGVERS